MEGAPTGRLATSHGGFLWEGMFLDEDAPPRRENAYCVDCECKMNSYNAAYDIRCYRCKRLWNEKADELAYGISWEGFGNITSVNRRRFDELLIDFIDQLKAKSTGIYYGDAFQEIAERTGRQYEPLRARSRRLVRNGRLERPKNNNKLWAIPGTDWKRSEQLELIMDDTVKAETANKKKSKYPNVSWDPKLNKWMGYFFDREVGVVRNLGHGATEEEAYELVEGFLEMREKVKKEEDDVEIELSESDLTLEFEEDAIYA